MTGANYHHSWSSLMAVAKVSWKHRGWKQNTIVRGSKYDKIKNRRANKLTPASVVDSLSETVSMSKQANKSFVRCFKWTERPRHATVCITLQNRRWHPHPSILLGLTKVLSACVLPFMSEIWWWTWSCYPCLKDCRCLCRHTMLLFWSFLCMIHSCELYGSWDCTNTPCWFHYKQ